MIDLPDDVRDKVLDKIEGERKLAFGQSYLVVWHIKRNTVVAILAYVVMLILLAGVFLTYDLSLLFSVPILFCMLVLAISLAMTFAESHYHVADRDQLRREEQKWWNEAYEAEAEKRKSMPKD